MEIAFVYDAVYPWEKGGAQKRVWELARRLTTDHEVHLFGMQYWDESAVIEREDVTFHGVCPAYELYTDGRRSIPPALKFATQLIPALQGHDFDIIDCQQFPYFPVFSTKLQERVTSAKLVVTWYEVWGDYWDEYLSWKGIAGKGVESLAMRLPHTIVPISTFIRDELVAAGREKGLEVVENGVDVDRIQSVTEAEADWDVVYVGRLAEHKHVDWLLEAVETAGREIGRPVRTCIVGDGPERERLEGIADSYDLEEVHFQGFVESDADVIGHLKAADVFVLPSTREGFPNTILEANAGGVPSIVVDHEENGSTAVVEHGETGLIADPDPTAIANCIATVLTDHELQQELSRGARRYGRAHDWDKILTDLEEVYSKVLAERDRQYAISK